MSERLNTLIDNKALQVQDNPVLQGNFAPVDIENSFDQLEVIGSIPENLREHLFCALQILNADAAHDGVYRVAFQRDSWVLVEVAHEKVVESIVTPEFRGIHAVAVHLGVLDLAREVRHPGRAQIKHFAVRRNALTVELGDLR
ncbi:MAG TPA: hypothetical protein DCE20_10235 [Gammaproteobacteria bacterium]|nr:hypothetical protein [Gammaproteobacteria bacterium]